MKAAFVFLLVSLCIGVHSAKASSMPQVDHVQWTAKTATKARVEWSDVHDATYYEVLVKKDGNIVKIKTVDHAHAVIKHLAPDTSYSIKVRACDAASKCGQYSTKEKVRTKITTRRLYGTLFGFWGLNGFISSEGLAHVRDTFGMTVFQVASSDPYYTVHTLLPLVRNSGLRVTLRMTDDHNAYSTNGNFDIDKWKAQIAAWKNSGVQEFINDGTLVAHMLLDDIDTFSGANPTAEELDEMARYSKKAFPHLMTYVRQDATEMPLPNNSRQAYKYLDAVDNQYTVRKGAVTTYANKQRTHSKSLHVATINGMNIADGGDCSSGQPGWSEGKCAMSADEISTYGSTLNKTPHLQIFLLWEYDGQERWSDGSIGSDYFNESTIRSALYYIAERLQ